MSKLAIHNTSQFESVEVWALAAIAVLFRAVFFVPDAAAVAPREYSNAHGGVTEIMLKAVHEECRAVKQSGVHPLLPTSLKGAGKRFLAHASTHCCVLTPS